MSTFRLTHRVIDESFREEWKVYLWSCGRSDFRTSDLFCWCSEFLIRLRRVHEKWVASSFEFAQRTAETSISLNVNCNPEHIYTFWLFEDHVKASDSICHSCTGPRVGIFCAELSIYVLPSLHVKYFHQRLRYIGERNILCLVPCLGRRRFRHNKFSGISDFPRFISISVFCGYEHLTLERLTHFWLKYSLLLLFSIPVCRSEHVCCGKLEHQASQRTKYFEKLDSGKNDRWKLLYW